MPDYEPLANLHPSYADLLRDHPEVIQGQAYPQDKNDNPTWREPQPAAKFEDRA